MRSEGPKLCKKLTQTPSVKASHSRPSDRKVAGDLDSPSPSPHPPEAEMAVRVESR